MCNHSVNKICNLDNVRCDFFRKNYFECWQLAKKRLNRLKKTFICCLCHNRKSIKERCNFVSTVDICKKCEDNNRDKFYDFYGSKN